MVERKGKGADLTGSSAVGIVGAGCLAAWQQVTDPRLMGIALVGPARSAILVRQAVGIGQTYRSTPAFNLVGDAEVVVARCALAAFMTGWQSLIVGCSTSVFVYFNAVHCVWDQFADLAVRAIGVSAAWFGRTVEYYTSPEQHLWYIVVSDSQTEVAGRAVLVLGAQGATAELVIAQVGFTIEV